MDADVSESFSDPENQWYTLNVDGEVKQWQDF
jgi:hypothetical protein